MIIMKINLISYSGRKSAGNCISIVNYIEEKIKYKYQVTKFNIADMKIAGCVGCEYQCFKTPGECPKSKDDDVSSIYSNILNSDISVMVIPVYSAAPPSTFFALRERAQSIIIDESIEKSYNNTKKLYVIVGNTNSGALDALNIVLSESKSSCIDDVLVLESRIYNQRSTQGNLVEIHEVEEAISDFLKRHQLI